MSKHVSIPRRKADMEKRYERHEWLPALNVKVYDAPEYTAERIVAEFGCSEAAAERAAQYAYESAQEQFWEQATDSLNFAMLGDERASQFKPCGLKDGPYEVYSDGRSGGWLVVKGLGTVEEMDGPTFQKWRKFARFIGAEIDYLLTWDYGREMIEANEWAPRIDTSEAQRSDIRHDRKAERNALEAFFAIHSELTDKPRDDGTLDRIAGHVRGAGLAIPEASHG